MKHTLLYLTACAFLILSCKKSGSPSPAPDPTPIILPDTIPANWSKIKVSPNTISGGDIFFKNNSVGFFGDGMSKIYKTTDGGTNWSEFAPQTCYNIAMTSDSKAFFVGNSNSISLALNNSLPLTQTNLDFAWLSDIFFIDNNNGIACSNAAIYRTADGGISWIKIATLPDMQIATTIPMATFMYDTQTAWVCYSNRVWHCNGNINNWVKDTIIPVVPPMGIGSVYAVSANVVYCSSFTGYIYKSIDGGKNFVLITKLHNGQGYGGSDLHFIDSQNGYLSVGSRLYKTTDGGANWTKIIALGNAAFVEIHFTDASHGWACCTDGSILKMNY